MRDIFHASPESSGLFLPSIPECFGNAQNRVMVVGMETKSWQDRSCPFKTGTVPTIDAVVESMNVHRRCQEGAAGHHKFLQFLKHVTKATRARFPVSEVAVLWAH